MGKPTIIIASDKALEEALAKRLPPQVCRLVHADTTMAVLGAAGQVAAVVVDSALPGAIEICHHLRSDPLTAHVVLIFLARKASDDPGVVVEARIPREDLTALDAALRRYIPAIALSGQGPSGDSLDPEPMAGEPTEEEGVFGDEVRTAIFRRPETEPGTALEWPPPPPNRKPGQEMVEYIQEYAGYFNSLLEAVEQPERLSAAERLRLAKVAHLTLDDAEVLLGAIQTAINEALMDKDLVRMRVLSAGKNSLYEKRTKLRNLAQNSDILKNIDRPEPPPLEGTDEEERPKPEPGVREAPVPGGFAPSGPGPAANRAKSELTLAAEAKEAERRAAHVQRRKDAVAAGKPMPRAPEPASGQARIQTKPSYAWIWVPVAGLTVLVATLTIIYSLSRNRTPTGPKKNGNQPPAMKWVILEQTPAGIVARPQATDKEDDRVAFTIVWYKNGRPVVGEYTARLKPSIYRTGDNIFAEVTPSDIHGQGRTMRSRDLSVKALDNR